MTSLFEIAICGTNRVIPVPRKARAL